MEGIYFSMVETSNHHGRGGESLRGERHGLGTKERCPARGRREGVKG
jgi:hypothetical protein